MDYYYYYNLTANSANNHAVPGYGNHNCVPKLYNLEEDKVKELFQLIIKLNNWRRSDEISAASANEDNAVIIYRDDELYYHDPMEEPESNLPPDDMDADEPWDAADHDHQLNLINNSNIQESWNLENLDDADDDYY